MNHVENFGCYKIWHYPRKGVYIATRISGNNHVEVCFNHKRCFSTIEELKSEIESQGVSPTTIVSNDPYNVAIRWLRDESNKDNKNYEEIERLVGQYYYGIAAKKELESLVKEFGLLKEC